ncbi:hypothetical protein RHMOL_Rhmol05G0313400 [Rhododendron molle]|uniref:Uncharacterized protein n=1 Tax=Rhododendron molle TaxID=49168 RepID=A0ACC0NX98_RHOML|nr:hypothetical protein RHMOL_Rhmol05G0313400 [Rhododendron molle]
MPGPFLKEWFLSRASLQLEVESHAQLLVAQWGQLLVALNRTVTGKLCQMLLVLQLCSMVRDMSLKVRVEASDALGEISMVSEEILLQTLSKKLLSVSLQASKPTLQRHGV